VLACINIAWIARAIELPKALESFLPALKRAQAAIESSLERDSPP